MKLKAEDIYADMNDMQEEMFPGFKKAIEAQHHVSRQQLWHHQFYAFPKIPQKALSVEGLYFVGDGTTPLYGAGVEGSASTGIMCAKNILGIADR